MALYGWMEQETTRYGIVYQTAEICQKPHFEVWVTMAGIDWVCMVQGHLLPVDHGDVLECVGCVQPCCESIGDNRHKEEREEENQVDEHCEYEDYDLVALYNDRTGYRNV